MEGEAALRRIYRDPSKPGSFGGVLGLHRQAKKEGIENVNKEDVKRFLESENAYTLHGRVIRSKKGVLNERIIVSGPFDLWEADLMDPPKGRRQRGKHVTGRVKFLLTVVDASSKHAWVEPMVSKTAKELKRAFGKILAEGIPAETRLDNLRTDAGTEFFNAEMKKFYKDNGINHYRAQKEPGAALIERFIRTLGDKFERYTTANPQSTQADILAHLPGFVAAYNASQHSATRTTPDNIHDNAFETGGKNAEQILQELRADPTAGREQAEAQMGARYMSLSYKGRYKDPNPLDPVHGKKKEGSDIEVGTPVRLLLRKNMFEKGRKKTFTDEVWTVKEVNVGGNPNAYYLMDGNGETMVGKVYRRQLQRLSAQPETWEINVIGRRTRNGVPQIQVEWVGHPQSAREWIPESSIA